MGALLLILVPALPIIEIYFLIQFGEVVGFWRTIAYVALMIFLGSSLIKAQGRELMIKAQASLAKGEVPTGASLHGILVIIGAILLVIPGLITDFVGLFFILPGTRHFIARIMKQWLAKQAERGRMHVFGKMGGMGGFGGTGGFGGFGQPPPRREDDFGPAPHARDVTPKVIDIRPIKSDTTEGGDSNS